MTEYRCPFISGAIWFFTISLAERGGNRLLIEKLNNLPYSFRSVQTLHPLRIDAVLFAHRILRGAITDNEPAVVP